MAASYPTTPKTFTTKNDGDDVMASHVNDLQDEVAAIESGLLNGTAPVNAAASTFTSLSVAGGSTVRDIMPAADSTYALGNSTRKFIIHGSQLSTGTVPVAALASTAGTASTGTFYRGDGVWAAPAAAASGVPLCVVALSTNVSIGANAWDSPNWGAEVSDAYGMHAANSSQIVFSESTGQYLVGVSVNWSTAATVTGRVTTVRIMKNDTESGPSQAFPHILEFVRDLNIRQTAVGLVRAESTSDYVTVQVFHQADVSMNLLATLATGGQSFWAYRVST